MKNCKKWIIRFLIFLVGLELILRLAGVWPHIPLWNASGPFRADPNLLWAFKPSYDGKLGKIAFKTNSLGLRAEEINEKKPDEYRILVLGGSVTAGTDVEVNETYVAYLQEMLNHDFKKKFNIINAGVPGYSPFQYLHVLRNIGPKINADMVLLDFAINDVLEGRAKPSHVDSKPEFRMKDAFLALDSGKGQRQNLINRITDLPRYTSMYTTYFWLKKVAMRTFSKKEENFFDWMEQELLNENPSAFVEQSWEKTKQEVREIRDMAVAQHARFAMVIFPLRQQVQTPAGLDRPQRIIREFTQKEDIVLVDLLAAFRKEKDNPKIFIDSNHIAPPGHHLVARTIATALEPTLAHLIQWGVGDLPPTPNLG